MPPFLEKCFTFLPLKFLMTFFSHLPYFFHFFIFSMCAPIIPQRKFIFDDLFLVVDREFEFFTSFTLIFTFFATLFGAVPPPLKVPVGASRPHRPLGTPLTLVRRHSEELQCMYSYQLSDG